MLPGPPGMFVLRLGRVAAPGSGRAPIVPGILCPLGLVGDPG